MFSRQRAHAERKQRWLRSGVLSKMAEDSNSGTRIVEQIIIFFAHKKYFRIFVNYG